VSDLYSAKLVFVLGFLGCAVLALGISFTTDKYAFFVLRAIYGIFAAATVRFPWGRHGLSAKWN
jgi:MFS family permease